MADKIIDRPISLLIITFTALVFGLLTIKSGGAVLFVDGIGREEAGNYVPFVVWFNFLAGFIYVLAGIGLFLRKNWAVWLSIAIATATVIVFGIFAFHVLNDGLYETRTVAAMSLRTSVWAMIALYSYRKILT